jgi:hypothetical protein
MHQDTSYSVMWTGERNGAHDVGWKTAAEIDAIFQRLTMPGVLAGLGRLGAFPSS